MKRGEIWWASLPEPSGSAPGFRRPLVVLQSDSFNRSRISTIIAAVITSNLRLADAPANVLVSAKIAGLKKDSVINVSQLITVDKSYLTEKTGKLPAKLLQELEEGLRLVLAL
ncbi:MAG: type II toxin-antitoxin system PemK/MazF family toxin [Gammaproteobacteria bacterium]|nr:type II toxin-antitoxin system PemK/MazF family toxin [Gammaproteobacteria bacterium]